MVTKKERSEAAKKGWQTRKRNQKLARQETNILRRAARIEKMIEEADKKDADVFNGEWHSHLTKIKREPTWWERWKLRWKENRDRQYNWAMNNWKRKEIYIVKDIGPVTFIALMMTEFVLLFVLWVAVMIARYG